MNLQNKELLDEPKLLEVLADFSVSCFRVDVAHVDLIVVAVVVILRFFEACFLGDVAQTKQLAGDSLQSLVLVLALFEIRKAFV